MKGVLNWEKRAMKMNASKVHLDHGGGCSHRLTRMCFANGKTVSIVEAAVSKVHMTRLIEGKELLHAANQLEFIG